LGGRQTKNVIVLDALELSEPLTKHAVAHLNVAVLVTRREHKALGKRQWPVEWRARQWRKAYDDLKIALHEPTFAARSRPPSELT
jgi:hypothetical protein